MLDTWGWGLYKQGKYEEALKILQQPWKLIVASPSRVQTKFWASIVPNMLIVPVTPSNRPVPSKTRY